MAAEARQEDTPSLLIFLKAHARTRRVRTQETGHGIFMSLKQEAPLFRAGRKSLEQAGFDLKQKISFYVLAGFDSTFEQDLYRCNKLRDRGVNAFVMRYHNKDKRINRLAKWTNRRWAYWSSPFPSS
jgi:hypothetical protein